MSGLPAEAGGRSGSCRWTNDMHRLYALVLLLAALPVHAQVDPDELRLVAPGVSDTPIRVRVLLPPGYAAGTSRYPVLYLNDGQDLLDVGVETTLQQLYAARAIQPLIVVAMDMPPDRMGGYGLFDRSGADAINATRLVHRLVDSGARMHRPEVFLAAGTTEEANDRDGDGIIDVIDDAHDLLDGWKAPDGKLRKGLRQLGYRVNLDYAMHASTDTALLYVLDGGQHNQASWARMLPHFLRWAYGAQMQLIDANATQLPVSVTPHATHPRQGVPEWW